MSDYKLLMEEYEIKRTERMYAESEWQRIADYLMPNFTGLNRRQMMSPALFDGAKKTQKIFDTTGIDAMDKLISLIIGTATSESFRWFGVEHEIRDLNYLSEVQSWCETVADMMYDAILDSNFSTAGSEAIRDIVGFGTGQLNCFEVDHQYNPSPGFRGLLFKASPIGTYVIGENAMGVVDRSTREFVLSGHAIKTQWPNVLKDVDTQTAKKLNEKPWERHNIIHAVYPEGRKFESCYLLRMPTGDGKTVVPLSEKYFDEMPFACARWDKATDEVWGFGRGHLVMPEVATLNRARQLKLRQWALAVHPPLLALDDGVISSPRIIPGAINRIRVDGALKPFEFNTRFDHQAIPEAESKLQIRQIFYTEQILQFAPQAKTPPSATEVLQRMEFLHQLIGPSLGRFMNELFRPTLNRVFALMAKANVFPPPPPIMTEFGGRLRLRYEGPLARAQRSDELRAMQETIALNNGLAAVNPAVWDNYDIDEMSRDLSRLTGSSKRYVVPVGKRDQDRQRRQQQAAQVQQQAAMVEQSAAAKNFAQAQQAQAAAAQPVQ